MIYKHNTTKNIFLTITMILSIVISNFAQTKDTTAPPANPLSITGLVDVNYNYNFNNPLSRMNGYRNFDVQENS